MANGFKRHRPESCGPWTAARLPVTGHRLQRWVTRAVGLPRYAAAVLHADARPRQGEPLTAREAPASASVWPRS